jgi:rare lipoprotein A
MREKGSMMHRKQWLCLIIMGTFWVLWFAPLEADLWYAEKGLASWYGKQFNGRQTADGTRFSEKEMTAAHRKLPLGTKVVVKNLETGKQVEVKITDRGPYADPQRRIIDLSRAAADSIGLVERGLGQVRVVVTEPAPARQEPKDETFYEVQVGAFEEYEAAQWVFEQLQERYPAVFIDPRDGPVGRYYRVRIGPFRTEEQAGKVAKVLKQQGHRIFVDEVPVPADVEQAQMQ